MAVDVADHELAARLATEAGHLLVEIRRGLDHDGDGITDEDAKRIKDEGDRRSHQWLIARLGAERPADAVLSEEGADDAARLRAARVWIVDPLDGTREFGEPPRDDWAVHVALVVEGTPVVGAVALPALGVTFATPTVPAPPTRTGRVRVVVSRTRATPLATGLAEKLDGELVAMGSAGAKAMAVVRGEVDVYAHSGGQYEWDSAAPVAVAMAADLHVSRLDGTPLVYNRPEPYLPDLLICRRELRDDVLAAVRLG